jgi:hypothetical protein
MSFKKYWKRYLLIGVFICLVLSIGIILRNTLLSCSTYECLLFPDKNLWKIQTVYEKDSKVFRGLLKHPDYLVRIERVSLMLQQQKADDLTKIRLMQILGLFDTAQSPYPGVITDRIVCDDKYKPHPNTATTTSGIGITYFSAFLNNRLQYGICTDDQIVYKVYTALFSCQQTNDWYSVEIIVPKENAATDSVYIGLFRQIGCQRPSVNTGKLLP